MSQETKRLMTDGTGQDIVSAIESLASAVRPIDATNINIGPNTMVSVADKLNSQDELLTQQSNNKKNVQAEVSNPTASGTATEFVSEITQNAQGVITPKRAGVPTASTSAAGLVQLNDTLTSSSTSQALTAAQGKVLNDKIVKGLDEKAEVICKTIDTPASIISFNDGANNLLIKELKVGIEPVQDLHGYDHPWPGGGGKNLLPLTVSYLKEINDSGTWTNNSYVHNGVTFAVEADSDGNVTGITVNGTASNNVTLSLIPSSIGKQVADGGYILNGCPSGGSSTKYRIVAYAYKPDGTFDTLKDYGSGFSIPSETYEKFYCQITIFSGYDASNLAFQPMLRLTAETDPTFEPYSNLCPISGWTGAKVTRTGKNLLDVSKNTNGYVISGTGVVTELSVGTYSELIPVAVGEIYMFTAISGLGSLHWMRRIVGYDSSGTYSRVLTDTGDDNFPVGTEYTITATIPSGIAYIRVSYDKNATDAKFKNVTVYPITFPSEAGTVYGGELTVNKDGNGSLVVDRANVDLGTLTWSAYAASLGAFTTPFSEMKNNTINALCSQYVVVSNYVEWSAGDRVFYKDTNGKLHLKDSTYANYSVSEFKTAMSGVQLVYELATPVTYSLTAPQVKTLLGFNNIWADTGDINLLTYPVDGDATYAIAKHAEDIKSIQNKIGNTILPTTAQTLTEAIAEHENDLTSVNNKITKISTGGEQLVPASLDALKTGLLTVADSVDSNQFIGIRIYPSFTANGFIAETIYCGYLYNIYKDNGTTVYLSASIYNNLGEDMIIAYNNGTWTFNSLTAKTQTIISDLKAQIMQSIYPIGSIYSSTESTSPATLFGFGTWERIKDRFLLAAGDTYTAGDTGGAASVSYTPAGTVGGHTLTIDEIPSHNHTFTGNAVNTGNNSVGHTHTYTDYYATTTGGTSITVAQMASHNHGNKSLTGSMLLHSSGSANIIDDAGGILSGANGSNTQYRSPGDLHANSGASSKGGLNIDASHTHNSNGSGNSHTHSGANTSTTRTSNGISANHTHSVTASGTIGNKGGGGSHDHGFTGIAATITTMPPYQTVYMWKRTA